MMTKKKNIASKLINQNKKNKETSIHKLDIKTSFKLSFYFLVCLFLLGFMFQN